MTLLDVYVFLGNGLGFEFCLWKVFDFVKVEVYPYLPFSMSTGHLGLGVFKAIVCFLISSPISEWFVDFIWNSLGKWGSVGTGFGLVAFVTFTRCLWE